MSVRDITAEKRAEEAATRRKVTAGAALMKSLHKLVQRGDMTASDAVSIRECFDEALVECMSEVATDAKTKDSTLKRARAKIETKVDSYQNYMQDWKLEGSIRLTVQSGRCGDEILGAFSVQEDVCRAFIGTAPADKPIGRL